MEDDGLGSETASPLPPNVQAVLTSILVVIAFLFIGGILVVVEKVFTPGYGITSYFTRTQEERDNARTIEENRVAVFNFVRSLKIEYAVHCPDSEKWATMSEVEQLQWHSYYEQRGEMLFEGSETCYH